MAFFKSGNTPDRETANQGVTSYGDVYQILKDNVDDGFEFYEIEPAIVIAVYLNPDSLPNRNIPGDASGRTMKDYSLLGTIKAKWARSEEQVEIEGYIKPISSHMVVYPLIGEAVNIATHGSQMYYYSPLNIRNHVNMNVSNNTATDRKITAYSSEHNRNILSEYGDVVVNGRFGNSIKFGSDPEYKYPDIKITNRQSVSPQKTVDEYWPHVPSLNSDGSSIFITSGPIRDVDVIIPSVFSFSNVTIPDVMDGDMITLNSDRLVFNSKKTDIFLFANINLNLLANDMINLELGPNPGAKITLGDPLALQPILKGGDTIELFTNIFSKLTAFCNVLSKATGLTQINDAAIQLNDDLVNLAKDGFGNLGDIASDKVFISENFADEFPEMAEVTTKEYEVEKVTNSAGVRG